MTGLERSRRTQEVFTGVMLALASVLGAVVWAGSIQGRTLFTVSAMFAVGGVLTCVALVAGVAARRSLLLLASAGLVVVGVAALWVLILSPEPRMDPVLFASRQWTRGPVPLGVGWPYLVMAGAMLITGMVAPLARSKRHETALLALTLVRASLWAGAFWQLVYVFLNGRVASLFEGAAGIIQVGLVIVIAISLGLLLRGDRGWMRTLTSADRSVSFASFIVPGALLPVMGAFMATFGARRGAFTAEVGMLLSIEISSVALMMVGLAILRSMWRERRARESLAHALAQSTVIVHSREGRIEYWSRGCEALYEFTASEAVGRLSWELLRTAFPVPLETILETLRTEGEWSGELRQFTRGGRSVWMASRVVIHQPVAGGGEKIVETLTDITDLKLTHAALGDTADALTQAVATYELGIVDHDVLADRTTFSPEFERIVGVAPGALGDDRGEAWKMILSPEDAARMAEEFDEDVAARTSHRSLSIKIRRLDGEVRDLRGMLRYRYSPDGAPLRMVAIYMDVTDQLHDRAEVAARGTRLMEMQWELTHTSRLSAMGEMAAALAHELNQPLTAVGNSVGAIGLILKDDSRPVDDKTRQRVLRAAGHAEAQAVRAGEIVRRLREFISRGEADTQAEDLGGLIDDAVALALPNPAATGVSVRRIIDPGASRVLADRIQVQQVLVNVVRNAVEAMREQESPRRLCITATATEGMAHVRVTDTGSGVPPGREDMLFAPFQSSKRDGMGVGLSICRRIIEAHGGKMWFEPADGGGACFSFTLPVISSEVGDGGG